MVLYDAMVIVRASAPRAHVAEVLRKLGARVFDAGGVVCDVASYGARTLAYEFRTPGEKHFEAQFVKMTFNAPPRVIAEAQHALRVDERVLRWLFTKKRALKRLNDFKAIDPRNPNTMKSYDGRDRA